MAECTAVQARAGELAALAPERAQADEPHLVACSACRDEVARTRAVLRGLDRIPVTEPSRDLSASVMSRISSAPPPAWLAKSAPRPTVAPRRAPPTEPPPGFFASMNVRAFALPAAGLALVLALVVLVRPSADSRLARLTPSPSAMPAVESESPLPGGEVTLAKLTGRASAFDEGAWKDVAEGQSFPQGRRLRTEPGAKASLALPDGSRVDVAADSELFAFADRIRLRRGRARFDIRHRPERIFRVLVPDGEIRVLGTLFDVESRPQGTRVHLLHGRLEVQCDRAVERLEDGEGATFSGTKLTKLTAAAPLATSDDFPPATSTSEVPAHPDEPTSVGPDPKPTIDAEPAKGPAPTGLQ
jgi:hypothetical protein